jgi:AcrR family transcriptional regulator
MKNKSKTTENTEERILEAAETLFLNQGFANTTTGQIAQMAGCNQALVHYYYRTKEKLFEQIFEKKFREIVPIITSKFDTGKTFQEKIKNIVEAHFDFLTSNPKFFPFIYSEVTANPERIKSLVEKMSVIPVEKLVQLDKELQAEIKKGKVAKISSIDLALTIGSLNLGFVMMTTMMKSIANYSDKEINAMKETRKKEIVKTILERLKP